MMRDKGKPLIPEDRSLEDRAYDLFGEILLQRETAALLTEIEAEKARGDTAEMDAFFAKQDVKNLERIQRHFRRHRARIFFRETLPRIGQIAAIVIAVFTAAGSVAIATSHTLRVQMMQLLINIEEEYTELKLQEDSLVSLLFFTVHLLFLRNMSRSSTPTAVHSRTLSASLKTSSVRQQRAQSARSISIQI